MINHEDPSTQSLSPDSSVMLPLAMIGIPRSIQWSKSIQENRASVVLENVLVTAVVLFAAYHLHHLQFVLNAQYPCPILSKLLSSPLVHDL